MDTWDTRFPFTVDEINLFANLHNKATKFPVPNGIIPRPHTGEHENDNLSDLIDTVTEQECEINTLSQELVRLKSVYDRSNTLLRHLDLLLEAHKQLSLAWPPSSSSPSEAPVSPKTDELETQIKQIQSRIAHLESIESARSFLSTLSIPSAASSPLFIHSLRLLQSQNFPQDQIVIGRAYRLMEKCWDNAMTAMEKVLDRDLVSIETYLDDRVYRDLKNLVLKPLLQPDLNQNLLDHFASTYGQLRINLIRFVLDARLNSQFDLLPPSEQVLHLIERTRLLLTTERREFSEIFDQSLLSSLRPHLNKILENVGNLLFQRIELIYAAIASEDSSEISSFILPLMNSLLEKDSNDPFGLFLKLLTERFHLVNEDNSQNLQEQEQRTSSNNVLNV